MKVVCIHHQVCLEYAQKSKTPLVCTHDEPHKPNSGCRLPCPRLVFGQRPVCYPVEHVTVMDEQPL